MGSILEYAIYAAAFIAIVLGMEGLARVAQTFLGEERTIRKRLAKAQPSPSTPGAAPQAPDRVSALLVGRLPWLGETLERARAPFSALHVLLAALAAVMLIVTGLNAIGVPVIIGSIAGVAIGGGGVWMLLTGMVNRRRKKFLDQMPQCVDLIARSLQAGHPVATAMSVVGQRMPAPLGPEFKLVIEEMTYGLDRDTALANLLKRFPVPELRMFVASLEVTRESGGNLAEVFLKLAEQIRAKAQFRKKVQAISAEGRLSFWVVSALPFVVGGSLMLIRPAFYLDVAKDPMFWPLMSLSPVSLAIGSTMIWRMVNVKV